MALSQLSIEQARKLIDDGALVIDTRNPASYNESHLLGAIQISPNDLDKIEAKDGGAIIFYSATGDISQETLELLEKAVPDGYVLEGGINKWINSGHPIEAAKKTTVMHHEDCTSVKRCVLIGLGVATLIGIILGRKKCKFLMALPLAASAATIWGGFTGKCPISKCLRDYCSCKK